MTPEQTHALDVARRLIAAGVPVFAAPPDPATSTGFRLPLAWETQRPRLEQVDRWQPGWALCAVMGHRLDLLDVDPRNGGDKSRADLVGADLWPTVYAAADTPSGGTHEFVAPMGVGSRDAVRAGLDIKGGMPDGSGRGFAFIAPTVRASKTTGELVAYRWTLEPDEMPDEGDDSGLALAEIVRETKGKRASADPFVTVDGERRWPHTGPIPEGARYPMLRAYAGSLRRRDVHLDEAVTLFRLRWQDCAQPPAARFEMTWGDAEALLRDIFGRYAPDAVPAVVEDVNQPDPDEALEAGLAFNRAVSEEAHRLRVRAAAAAIVRQEAVGDLPAPDAGTLAELLARPVTGPRHRIEGILSTGGRMTWVGQRKTGKTTAVGNLIRSLLTGEPFLGRFAVDQVLGRVVVLNYEMTGDTFARWMDETGVPRDRLYVVNLRGRRNLLATDEGRAELVELIRAQDGEVLIVDPFGRAYTGKSQNDVAEVTPWLTRLDELAEAAGVSELILTAHAGWDGERTRGSTALEDWPDSIVTMTRDPDTDARFVRAIGRDVDVEEDRLDYDPTTRRLTSSGAGSRRQVRAGEHLEHLAELVAEIVTADPGVNVAGLRTALRDRDEHLQREDAGKAAQLAETNGWIRREQGPKNARLHFPVQSSRVVPESSPGALVSRPDPSYRDGTTTRTTQGASRPETTDEHDRAVQLLTERLGATIVSETGGAT